MPYIYCADIYCDTCGKAICDSIPNNGEFDDEYNYDSDEFPKYCGDDEADSPQHCGDCGEFLENGLTADGVEYVRETVKRDIENGRLDSVAITIWLPHYGVDNVGECANCGKLSIVDSDDLCEFCADCE